MAIANTTLLLKKSATPGNTPTALANGEIALNFADGKLYYKNASGVITYISSGATTNSFATINSNSSLILATSAADTLSFVAGNNISIATDTINKKITISSTATGNGGGTTTVYANAVSFVISDDVYVGDGTTKSFSLTSTPTNVYCVLVNINGVLQLTSSYTLANNVLTLSEAPASGASIEIKTTQGVTTGDVNNAISLAQAAFNQANTASANTIVTQGVDLTQNTNITTANNAAWAAFAAGNTNATNITSVNQYAAAAYAQANVTIGVDATQNSAISIIQGVDLTQNTNIQAAWNAANAAFNLANTEAMMSGWTANTVLVANAAGYLNNSNTYFVSANNTLITGNVIASNGTFTTITGQTEVLKGTGQNFLLQSQTFTVSPWSTPNSTLTANATTAPDGTNTGTKLQETAVTNFFGVVQNPTGSAGQTYTWSCYIKAAERTQAYINFSAANYQACFDTSTVTVVSKTAGTTATITAAANSWYRCTFTFTIASGVVNPLYSVLSTALAGNPAYAGTAGNGIYIWGAQIELSSTVNPYIVTTTTAVYGTPTLSFSGVAGLNLASNGSLYVSPAGSASTNVTSNLTVMGAASATSNTTGALVVTGGMGITGNVFLSTANNFASTTYGVSYKFGWTDNFFFRDDRFGGVNFNGGYLQVSTGSFNVTSGTGAAFSNGPVTVRSLINNDTGNNTVVFGGTSPVLIQNTTTSISNTTGALIVAGGLGISGNVYSGTLNANTGFQLGAAADGITPIAGSVKWSGAGGQGWLGVYDSGSSKYYGIASSLPSSIAAVGGYYSGMGVSGTSSAAGTPLFGVLNNIQSGNGLGNTAFTIYADSKVVTLRNTLDDNRGNANVTGNLTVGNTSAVYSSTSNTTGSLIVAGGMGITGNLFMSAANNFSSTTLGQSYKLGWTDNYFFRDDRYSGVNYNGNYLQVSSQLISSSYFSARGFINNDSGNNVVVFGGTSPVLIQNTTTSTSNTTGALIVSGGTGISGNLNVGGTNVNLSTGGGSYFSVVGGGAVAGSQTVTIGAVDPTGTTGNSVNLFYGAQNGGYHSFRTGASQLEQFRVSPTSVAVNYLQVSGNTTGNGPVLSAQGTDANVDINLLTKGTGNLFVNGPNGTSLKVLPPTSSSSNWLQVGNPATTVIRLGPAGTTVADFRLLSPSFTTFWTGSSADGLSEGYKQFHIAGTTSAVNYLQVTGGVTGSGATISAQGSDANVSLNLTSKGTGNVNLTAANTVVSGNLIATAVYTNGLFYANGTPYSTGGGSSVTLSDSVSSNSSTTAATSNAVLIAVSTALAYSIALG